MARRNYQTEETKKKISLANKLGLCGMKNKKHSEATKIKMKEKALGRKHSPETIIKMKTQNKINISKVKNHLRGNKEYYKQIGLLGLTKQQNSKEPTGIEKTLYDYLILKGIVFERQYTINGRFIVDAYIPSLNIVIEADGKYWHSLDKVVKKDKAENAYLKECGFNLVRIPEDEIKSGAFKERMVL